MSKFTLQGRIWVIKQTAARLISFALDKINNRVEEMKKRLVKMTKVKKYLDNSVNLW